MKPYDPSEVPVNAPRFIPTLTEVIELDDSDVMAIERPASAKESASEWSAAPSSAAPIGLTEPEPSVAPDPADASESLYHHPLTQAALTEPVALVASAEPAEPEPMPALAIEVSAPELPAAAANYTLPASPVPMDLPAAFTDELVHRVMQKVDFVLAERIKESVQRVIEQHTRSLIPRLHEELEFTVRKTIDDATSDVLLEILSKEPL